MKFAVKGAVGLTLALALAACGGGNDDTVPSDTATMAAAPAGAQNPVPSATDTAAAMPAPAATTPAPTVTPSASATPKPSPTPSASASAKPTPVAMATKPSEFAQCSACHSTDKGKNGIGPSLAGVFGDKAGAVPGYDFSDAMKASGLTWNAGNLDRFLTDPKGVVPGTKMTFPGIKDAAKRKAIIDYLKAI